MLPSQTFHEPTFEFIRLFNSTDSLRYKRIIDCGAGLGLTTKTLRMAGLDVTAVDVNAREGELVEVVRANLLEYEFDYDCLPILCRPCHGSFVSMFLDRVLRESPHVLYVGLERNIEEDLGGFVYDKIAADMGKEGEVALRVFCRERKARTFCRITLPDWNGESAWVQDGWEQPFGRGELFEDSWGQRGGGYSPKGTETILETVKRGDWDQLPWSSDSLLDPTQRTGWIGPDGKWFPCKYANHDAVMRDLLNISVRRAEEIGFVRCYDNFWIRPDEKRLTPKQKRVLDKNDYTVDDEEMVRSTI